MTAFNGLLQKEWKLMRWPMLGFVATFIVIAALSFAPIVVGGIFEVNEFDGMFSTILLFLAAGLFLQSLHTDMKKPDVWLHSPASIWMLLGVKMMMAVIFVIGSFLIWTGIGAIAYFFGGFVGIIPGMAILLKLLVNTIFMTSVSLLLWVIYKLVEVQIGWMAVFVVIFLIYAGSLLWAILLLGWEITGLTSSVPYIIVTIVLFAVGADLLEKKVRY